MLFKGNMLLEDVFVICYWTVSLCPNPDALHSPPSPVSINFGGLPCFYYLQLPAPLSLEAQLFEHDVVRDMCAALADFRDALLPPDCLR